MNPNRLILTLSFLLFHTSFASASPESNSVYARSQARQALHAREHFRGYKAAELPSAGQQRWLKVKFHDGTTVKLTEGELLSPQLDLRGLGLQGTRWSKGWAGSRAERLAGWQQSERALGQQLEDPLTFVILELPPWLSLGDAGESLERVQEVEAFWPLHSYYSAGTGREPGELLERSEESGQEGRVQDVFRDYGITGRGIKIFAFDVVPPDPAAGFPLPDYDIVTGTPWWSVPTSQDIKDPSYVAYKLNRLAGPLESDQPGIAPHAEVGLSFWAILEYRPGEDGAPVAVMDPARTLEVVGAVAKRGDVVVLDWCLGTYRGETFLGCLPLEFDEPTFSVIRRLALEKELTVVQWAGWWRTADANGGISGVDLDSVDLGFWEATCRPNSLPDPANPLCGESFAMMVQETFGGSPAGNTGATLIDANVQGGSIWTGGIAALAASGLHHIGASSHDYLNPLQEALWGVHLAELSRFRLGDARATMEALYQTRGLRSASSLRVQGPLPGFQLIQDRATQNLLVREGDKIELPALTINSETVEIPLSIFNDGHRSLEIRHAELRYSADSTPVEAGREPVKIQSHPSLVPAFSRSEIVLAAASQIPGAYRFELALETNDPVSRARNFEIELAVTFTDQAGLRVLLVDADGLPLQGSLDFGSVQWAHISEHHPSTERHGRRVVGVRNLGGDLLEVEIDVPSTVHRLDDGASLLEEKDDIGNGAEFFCPGRDCPSRGGSIRFFLAAEETRYLTFDYPNHKVGVQTAELDVRVKRYGAGNQEDSSLPLVLRGESLDTPNKLRIKGCDGSTRTLVIGPGAGGIIDFDLGMAPFEEVPPDFEFETFSSTMGSLRSATKVADYAYGDGDPVGVKLLKKAWSALDTAKIVVELSRDLGEASEKIGAGHWVEVELGQPTIVQRFFFGFSIRPFVQRDSTTFTLASPQDRVSIYAESPDETRLCFDSRSREVDGGPLATARSGGIVVPAGYVHDFGEVTPGLAVEEAYTITNTSATDTMRIEDFRVDGAAFAGELVRSELGPGESTEVLLSFQGGVPGEEEKGYFSFRTDNPNEVSPFWVGELRARSSRPVEATAIVVEEGGSTLGKNGVFHFPLHVRQQNPPGIYRRFEIRNVGQETLRFSQLRLLGDDGFYLVLDTAGVAYGSLETGDSWGFDVYMDTTEHGSKSGTLEFQYLRGGRWEYFEAEIRGLVSQVDLNGLVVKVEETGEFLESGQGLDFGEILAHESASVTLLVENGTNLPIRFSRPSYAAGAFFRFSRLEGIEMQPGERSRWAVHFEPDHEGSFSASPAFRIDVEADDGWWQREAEYVIPLKGEAERSPGSSDLLFVDAATGEAVPNGGGFSLGQAPSLGALAKTLELHNIGSEPVEVADWALSGESAGDYRIRPWNHSVTLAPGEKLDLEVGLTAPEPGIYRARLHNRLTDIVLESVVGEGVVFRWFGNPVEEDAWIDLPETLVGSPAQGQLEVQNLGTRSITWRGAVIENGTGFRLVGAPDATELEPGESLEIGLESASEEVGDLVGVLRVDVENEDGLPTSHRLRTRGRVSPVDPGGPRLAVSRGSGLENPEYLRYGDLLEEREVGASTAEGLQNPDSGHAYFRGHWGVRVWNEGITDLEIDSFETSSSRLRLAGVALESGARVEPGGADYLQIVFEATEPGFYREWVAIHTNDPHGPFVFEVAAKVPERSTAEVYGPWGKLSSGDTLDLGVIEKGGFLDHWNLMVRVENTGDFPLWRTRIHTEALPPCYVHAGQEECRIRLEHQFSQGVDSRYPTRILPGQSKWLGLEVEDWRVNDLRDPRDFYESKLWFGLSDRSTEPFQLKVRWRIAETVSRDNVFLLVGNHRSQMFSSGGPRVDLGPISTSRVEFMEFRLENTTPPGGPGQGPYVELEEYTVTEPEGQDAFRDPHVSFGDSAIHAGGATILTATIDGRELTPGRYDGRLTIRSNAIPDPYVVDFRRVVLDQGPKAKVEDLEELQILRGGSYSMPSIGEGSFVSRAFRIYNAGDYPILLGPDGVEVSGTGYRLLLEPDGGTVIEPNEAVVFRVRFTGNQEGLHAGEVSFSTNEGSEPYVFALQTEVFSQVDAPSGTAPEITLHQAWDGGPVAQGVTVDYGGPWTLGEATSRRFRLENTGGTDLVVENSTALVSGPCFRQVEDPITPLAPGEVTYFRIRAECSTSRDAVGLVRIRGASEPPVEHAFHVAAEWIEASPRVVVRRSWDDTPVAPASTVIFDGSTPSGVPTSRLFEIENAGTSRLTLADPGGLVSGECFSLIELPPVELLPGESGAFRVRLRCETGGAKSGAVEISSNDPERPLFGFALEGNVEQDLASIAVFQAWDGGSVEGGGVFAFPELGVGDVGSRRFRIENTGTETLILANAASLVEGGCFSQIENAASVVEPGSSAYFRVRFRCLESGPATGSVTIRAVDSSVSPFSFLLEGEVLPEEVPITVRRAWDQGLVGDSDRVRVPQPITLEDQRLLGSLVLENRGEQDLQVLSYFEGGCFGHAPGFQVPTVIPGNGSVDLPLAATCGSAGLQESHLRLRTSPTDVEIGSLFRATLEAEIVEPEIRLLRGWPSASPAEIVSGESIALPIVAEAGSTTTSVAFQIHNDGVGDLLVENADASLVAGECFSIRSGGFPAAVVPPGTSSPFRVWWGADCPGGEQRATISLRSNDLDEDPVTFEVVGTISAAPTLECEPADTRVVAGQPATLEVCPSSSAGEVSFEWFKDGQVLGVTSRVLELPAATAEQEGAYHVEVSNDVGSAVSRTARVNVIEAPVVTSPVEQQVSLGETAVFSVEVLSPDGDGPFEYRWQIRPESTLVWEDVPSVTGPQLVVPGVTADQHMTRVRCYVSNEAGETNSGGVRLRILFGYLEVTQAWDGQVPEGSIFHFGEVEVGQPSSYGFHATNVGVGTLTLRDPETWVNGTCFNLIQEPNLVLQPGESSILRIRARCTVGGTISGSLMIGSDSPNSPSWMGLRAEFVRPELTVLEASTGSEVQPGSTIIFPQTGVGVPVSRAFEIVNSGRGTLDLSNATAMVSGACWSQIESPVAALPAGASSILRVRLHCESAGTQSGTVRIESDDPGGPFQLQLVGTVVDPRPDVAVFRDWDGGAQTSGSTFLFPETPAGVAESRRFRITNTGSAPLNLLNASSLVSGTCFDQIESPSASVAPGATTSFRVRLYCLSPGSWNGTIAIYSDDPTSPYLISVQGTVTAPLAPDVVVTRDWDGGVQGSGSTYQFSPIAVGAADSRRFRITNGGTGTLTISNPTALVSGSCWTQIESPTATVAPGATTSFRVRLSCTTPGTKTGEIAISSNDPTSPYTISLVGDVIAADAGQVTVYRDWDGTVQPEGQPFTFPSTTVGTAVSRRFRITNSGTGTLTISNPTTMVSGSCWHQVEDPTASVAPGASTHVRVRLSCTTTGTKTGTVSIQSDEAGSPFTFGLSGIVQ